MENAPLRLITARPLERLARTVEALLVVAAQPLSLDDLATAADADPARVESALDLLGERYAEGRSGIVLERVAEGFAFRAAREEAEACERLFERVFGLESLAELPRLEELGGDAAALRERLDAVASERPA